MTLQFRRKVSLIVSPNQGTGLELSQLHLVFRVTHQVIETPNTLAVRIYNLSDNTAQTIAREFTEVTLKAGYDGNFGIIFQGTIKQTRKGRENPTDTYFDIFAADSDLAYNWGFINTALAAGYSQQDVASAIAKAAQQYGIKAGNTADTQFLPQKSPRGKVMFGAVKDHARVLSKTNSMDWSFYQGQMQYVPQSAFLPGQAVVLTSRTGMIGLPEQTEDGIRARCLLNPAIGPGTRVQINNRSIQQMQLGQNISGGPGTVYAPQLVPTIANDGMYKVLFVDHFGDTRGNDWYSDITCLAVDSTYIPTTQTVQEVGIPE